LTIFFPSIYYILQKVHRAITNIEAHAHAAVFPTYTA